MKRMREVKQMSSLDVDFEGNTIIRVAKDGTGQFREIKDALRIAKSPNFIKTF